MWVLVVVFFVCLVPLVVAARALMGPQAKVSKQTIQRLDAMAPSAKDRRDKAAALDIRRGENLIGIPWLDALLKRVDIATRLQTAINQADAKVTVGKILTSSVAIGVLLLLLVEFQTGELLFACAAGIAGAAMPTMYVLHKRGNRFDKMRELLPEALDMMSSAIRAGHSMASAMNMTAKESPEPIRKEFRQCCDEQNFGMDLRVAMLNLAGRVPIHDIRMVVSAVLIQADSGGNLTEILDQVAHLVREDFRLQGQIKVHTAQGRMTGWILSLLPAGLGFLLWLINPDQMSVLWTKEQGRHMLYGSFTATVVGALIIRKIVKIQV